MSLNAHPRYESYYVFLTFMNITMQQYNILASRPHNPSNGGTEGISNLYT